RPGRSGLDVPDHPPHLVAEGTEGELCRRSEPSFDDDELAREGQRAARWHVTEPRIRLLPDLPDPVEEERRLDRTLRKREGIRERSSLSGDPRDLCARREPRKPDAWRERGRAGPARPIADLDATNQPLAAVVETRREADRAGAGRREQVRDEPQRPVLAHVLDAQEGKLGIRDERGLRDAQRQRFSSDA